MRTDIHRSASRLGVLALLAGILLALSAPTCAQTITATPQSVTVAKDATQGSTTITWDAGSGLKNVVATLWQQIDGGKETLVSVKAKGSQSIFIGAGQTHVFKLRNFKNKVLASVTVTATEQGAATGNENDATTVSFAGMWIQALKLGGQDTTLTYKFEQTGNKVTGHAFLGSSEKQKINFEGVVSGNKLSFRASPATEGLDSGEFVMAKDGRSFTGQIAKTVITATALVNFGGAWRAFLGGAVLELILQQTGSQVTGQMKLNSGEFGAIREGIIVGNTLRFKIVRAGKFLPNGSRSPDEFAGIGELVLDEGGKSFTGHVLSTVTSGGTLIGR